MNEGSTPAKLWEPSPDAIERSRMTAYMRWLANERGVRVNDYDGLWHWSVDELEDFWSSIWAYFDVQADGDPTRVLSSREMPGARWFEGTELNYAEHIFRGKADGELAVAYASETREPGELTWGELNQRVATAAEGLRALGVGRGDRVVAYLPNSPEALVAFLATASLGAIWSSCSPDFGPSSVVDRFAQIEPKVMFAVDGYRYGGKDFDRMATVADIAGQIPSLERVVIAPYLSASPDLTPLETGGGATPMTLGQLAELGGRRAASLRARPVRPPALGPLLLGHDRPAEGDRPGPRRNPARAAEEAEPPSRHPARRPRLLVHDDRLDDVELPASGCC